jgi:hypothetical protein
VSSPNQADLDGDGIGDVCGPDADGDGVLDVIDSCPRVSNPGAAQVDSDFDGLGDLCDACPSSALNDEGDHDGVCTDVDNCPNAANPTQSNQDGDSFGDVCDSDRDDDGFANAADNCPLAPNPDQADQDNDLIGDACDPNVDVATVITGAVQGGVAPNPPRTVGYWRRREPSPAPTTLATGTCVTLAIRAWRDGSRLRPVHEWLCMLFLEAFSPRLLMRPCRRPPVALLRHVWGSAVFAWGTNNEVPIYSDDGDTLPAQCDNCKYVDNGISSTRTDSSGNACGAGTWTTTGSCERVMPWPPPGACEAITLPPRK